MLNILEYACIYLNKQSSEYKCTESMYKLLSSYQDRGVSRTLSNIKDEAFWKKNTA